MFIVDIIGSGGDRQMMPRIQVCLFVNLKMELIMEIGTEY